MNKLLLFAILHVTSFCYAQVPIEVQLPYKDESGQRFATALRTEIQLSNKFTLWKSDARDLPADGVHILLVSTEVKATCGSKDQESTSLGSAVFAIATHPSPKDPDAQLPILVERWFIRRDQPLTEAAREFLGLLVGK